MEPLQHEGICSKSYVQIQHKESVVVSVKLISTGMLAGGLVSLFVHGVIGE